MHFVHLINPYNTDNAKDKRIQKLTLDSMVYAAENSRCKIDLLAATSEKLEFLPEHFIQSPNLIRSFDYDGKSLPYLKDIVDQFRQGSEAEYCIYTNMDIILQPHFYDEVSRYLEQGHDALIINRRRIREDYLDTDLQSIYKEKGLTHPGFDCFVFHRDLLSQFFFGSIVLTTFIGVTFAHNLFCWATKPLLIDNEHLTTHIGLQLFKSRDQAYWRNRKEFFQVIKPRLWNSFDIDKFPYSERNLIMRYIKWALNPSLFTWMNTKLLVRKKLFGH